MAENSRSKVTITLGRSHQVVKKAGPALDSSFGDSESTVGRKRSVRDRLGGNDDSSARYDNKRQRADGSPLSLSASNGIDDTGLNKNDLRFKIMQKNMLKKAQSSSQQSGLDLRDMLSRPAQSSTTVDARLHMPERKDARQRFLEPRDDRQRMSELRDPRLHVAEVMDSRRHMAEIRDSRQHMPERKDARQHFPEPRDGRQYMSELSDPRLHMAEVRDSRQHMSELSDPRLHMAEVRDSRQHIAEVRDSRQHMLEWKDVGHHMPEPNSLSIMGRIPSTRVPGSLTHIDTLTNSYSPWTLERLRRRSPDRVISTSRGFSSPRREELLQRRPSVRPYDDIRVGSYMSKDVEFSRPLTSASHMTTAALPAGPAKPMAPPLAPPMPPGSLGQKSSYAVQDQFTVDSFLYSLGLEKYAINFKAEEVDMHALKQMGESDLKDLGIPMGPRKKILLALQSRAKRHI